MTIKGQALADFILQFDSEIKDKSLVLVEPSIPTQRARPLEEVPQPWWKLHVDGAINNGGDGAGIILVTPEGNQLMSVMHFKFETTNNDAEYETLINGLKMALEMNVANLIISSDCELVVRQVEGGFQCRGPRTELYMKCTHRLIQRFREVRLKCIPQDENCSADVLAKLGSQKDAMLMGTFDF